MPLSETEKRGRGRPRTGKVLFAKRVTPEVAARLEELISKDRVPDVAPAVVAPSVDTSQVEALLADVERLTAEAANWEDRFNKACDAFPDKQAQYWRAQFNKLKADVEAKNGSSQWAQ